VLTNRPHVAKQAPCAAFLPWLHRNFDDKTKTTISSNSALALEFKGGPGTGTGEVKCSLSVWENRTRAQSHPESHPKPTQTKPGSRIRRKEKRHTHPVKPKHYNRIQTHSYTPFYGLLLYFYCNHCTAIFVILCLGRTFILGVKSKSY
jgi:hypothetical protein